MKIKCGIFMKSLLNVEEIIKQLSIKEKALLLTGSSPMNNYGIERLNIPSLNFNDGPNGIRRLKEGGDSLNGLTNTLKATVFPCGAMLASSWNKDIFYNVGEAIAKEALYYGTEVILGPSVNIKRNPLCGRNFEYYSEDPFIAGKLAACYIKGMQKHHVGACVKHFACNNNEQFRFIGNSIVDERALREIYLKPYEIIIKESSPFAFMSSYNKVNGVFASENSFLIKKFLREENNYQGVIMTDWGGTHNRVDSINAGLDLEMPGECIYNINQIIDATKTKIINEETLNDSVRRILNLYNKTLSNEKVYEDIFEENYQIALDAALEGAVLLKNNGMLPLKTNKKILVIGEFFKNPRYQGSGSSLLNPVKFVSIEDEFKKNNIQFDYIQGYYSYEDDNKNELEKLNETTLNKYDAILFFGGQSDFVESEGFDRETLSLPKSQLKLINALDKYLSKTIFILFTGSAVEIPFNNKVNAILNMFMAGEAVGEALVDLLFGKANPSGKLTETYPNSYLDVPSAKEYDKFANDYYKESIFVGYRYYETINQEVTYPFGFGLSYTKFEYSNLDVILDNQNITISFAISNIGEYDGKEISQVYISKKESSYYRPIKELKGFDKTFIKKHTQENIKITVSLDDLKIFDPISKKWILEEGEYDICIGSSVKDIFLKKSITINENSLETDENLLKLNYFYRIENLKNLSCKEFCKLFNFEYKIVDLYKKPYTMETPIFALNSLVGNIFYKSIEGISTKKIKKAMKIEDIITRNREIKGAVFIKKLLPLNSLRSLSFSSGGTFPYNVAQGILEMCNKHYLKGIKLILKKEKLNE